MILNVNKKKSHFQNSTWKIFQQQLKISRCARMQAIFIIETWFSSRLSEHYTVILCDRFFCLFFSCLSFASFFFVFVKFLFLSRTRHSQPSSESLLILLPKRIPIDLSTSMCMWFGHRYICVHTSLLLLTHSIFWLGINFCFVVN